jgi:FKBP-type peptidyl-prolyl cis-trans isomerase FklB
MKGRILGVSLAVSLVLMAAGCGAGEKKIELNDQKAKISYGIGMSLGTDFKAQGIEIDPEVMVQAIKDVTSGGKTLMTEEEVRKVITDFQKELAAKQEAKAKEGGIKNQKDGEAFLVENSKKEGVVTLPSGLQYKVVKKGTGKKPGPTDGVTVHYKGTLIDGTEFDSSYKRGEPVSFPVGGVIPGWTEALQLMEEGSKWQLFIPAKLAYGERGAGAQIGPNSTLIFEVELLKVEPPKAK